MPILFYIGGLVVPLRIDVICNHLGTMRIGKNKDVRQLKLLWIYMLLLGFFIFSEVFVFSLRI